MNWNVFSPEKKKGKMVTFFPNELGTW
jgi:hypothetical protein